MFPLRYKFTRRLFSYTTRVVNYANVLINPLSLSLSLSLSPRLSLTPSHLLSDVQFKIIEFGSRSGWRTSTLLLLQFSITPIMTQHLTLMHPAGVMTDNNERVSCNVGIDFLSGLVACGITALNKTGGGERGGGRENKRER